MVSFKIHERFKSILAAFRYFDADHALSLTLNEFAQGIEHLRIKLSFNDVKALFNYLDWDHDGHVTLQEFKLLDDENWRRMDPIKRYMGQSLRGGCLPDLNNNRKDSPSGNQHHS